MSDLRRPIFIGGPAGSGKTPMRRVLGAHPDLCMTRKTYLWTRYHGRFGDLADDARFERCLAAILADAGAQRLEPDPQRLRREFRGGPATYARLFGLLHAHHAERQGCSRWGEQLAMVERYAGPIFAEYPEARMIHMTTGPRHAGRFRQGSARAWRLGPDVAAWTRSAVLAQRNRRRYPGRYRVVAFEHLTSRPRDTVLELCGFLGLEFVPEMERALHAALDAATSLGGRG